MGLRPHRGQPRDLHQRGILGEPIPQSKIKGNLGLRLLNLIEASIYEEEEE